MCGNCLECVGIVLNVAPCREERLIRGVRVNTVLRHTFAKYYWCGNDSIPASSTSVRLFVTIPSPPFKFDQFQKLRGLGSATGVQQPLLISRPPAPRACSAKGWSPNNPEGAFSACFQRGRELRRRRQFQSIRDQFPQIFRGCVGCGFPKYRQGVVHVWGPSRPHGAGGAEGYAVAINTRNKAIRVRPDAERR